MATEKLVRRYRALEEPSIGDLVILESDHEQAQAFSTCIVERIDKTHVHLARPMMRSALIFGEHGSGEGSAWLHAERYSVPLDLFTTKFLVHTTGASGRADNSRF